jgi:hypothetical protein
MSTKTKVSTKDKPERYGGILICGTNYGGKARPEIDMTEWADYFTDYKSNRTGDWFVSRLMSWFNWWGLPLETQEGKPTELNLAITQTNLFYDASPACDVSSKTKSEMNDAYTKLEIIIRHYDISGLIFPSSQLEPFLLKGDWQLPCGWQWEKQRHATDNNRFWLRFGSSGLLRVANCPHPRHPESRDDVKALSNVMQDWVGGVMEVYRRKQASLVNGK